MNLAGLFQFFLAFVAFSLALAQNCSVDFISLNENAPLIVRIVGAGPEYELIGPDTNGLVTLIDGNEFNVTCANSEAKKEDWFFKVACRKGTFKRVGSLDTIDLQKFDCKKDHVSAVVRICKNKDTLCPSGAHYTQFRIGFRVPTVLDSFIPWIDVCTDTNTKSVVFTNHTLHGRRCPSGRCSSYFKPSEKHERVRHLLGDLDAKKCYEKKNQATRFPGVVTNKCENYFARGHLTPDADAINQAFGKATYYYLNVIPQWQVINNGNWKNLVEDTTRDLASKHGAVKVFTGTHDYQTLSGHDLFCNKSMSQTPEEGIRIAKFMYKVVMIEELKDVAKDQDVVMVDKDDVVAMDQDVFMVDKDDVVAKGEEVKASVMTRRGIAFITSNDPKVSVTFPCSDVCGSTNFFVGKDATRKNFGKGETICCSVADLQKAVGHLTSIPNNVGLLINV